MAELKSAAIFDLDGTLIPHTSAEKTFIFYLLRNGVLSPLNLVQMFAAILKTRGNLHAITRVNKAYLIGKDSRKLQDIARLYFEPQSRILFFRRCRIGLTNIEAEEIFCCCSQEPLT
jgi:phosphoserine phosphatase